MSGIQGHNRHEEIDELMKKTLEKVSAFDLEDCPGSRQGSSSKDSKSEKDTNGFQNLMVPEQITLEDGENDPSVLRMRLEGAGHQTLDCECDLVGGHGDTLTYQCRYQVAKKDPGGKSDGRKRSTAARIEGKFAMNMPYVVTL